MQQKNASSTIFAPSFTHNLKVAIIKTDYHHEFTDNLEKNCRQTLLDHGVAAGHINTFIAPGSWEIPLIAQAVAQSKKFDAIVTFGVIIKGETHHFDMIANECARALMQLSLDYSLPIAIEVLAVYDILHAQARAGDNEANKGVEGAIAVLKALKTLRKII